MTPWPPPSHKNILLIHHLIPSILRHTIIPVLHGIAISWEKSHLPHMGNIWRGKILANHRGKSYWRGKLWQITYSQCICQIHFWCICEYWRGKSWRIADDSPNLPIFPRQIFPCTVFIEIKLINSKNQSNFPINSKIDRLFQSI